VLVGRHAAPTGRREECRQGVGEQLGHRVERVGGHPVRPSPSARPSLWQGDEDEMAGDLMDDLEGLRRGDDDRVAGLHGFRAMSMLQPAPSDERNEQEDDPRIGDGQPGT